VPKTANLYNGSPSVTDGQRWDSWGRFTSYLFATVPHQSINGGSDAPSELFMPMEDCRINAEWTFYRMTLRIGHKLITRKPHMMLPDARVQCWSMIHICHVMSCRQP